jgi:hypothetical protein
VSSELYRSVNTWLISDVSGRLAALMNDGDLRPGSFLYY